eukprot:5459502-Prymnesium_polylepis.1
MRPSAAPDATRSCRAVSWSVRSFSVSKDFFTVSAEPPSLTTIATPASNSRGGARRRRTRRRRPAAITGAKISATMTE